MFETKSLGGESMLSFPDHIVLFTEGKMELDKVLNGETLRAEFGFKITKIKTEVLKSFRNVSRDSLNINDLT